MGISTPAKPITIEEYLSSPAYEHSEYVHGEVVPLNLGTKSHSKIQINCGYIFKTYFKEHPGGYAASELHCRLNIRGNPHYRLPDVAVVLEDRAPASDYLEGAPDIVVEIRSPDDKFTFLVAKIEEYFANGTKLAWIILPEEQSVLVFSPNASPRALEIGATIDGGGLLPGFSVAVSEIFS